MCQTLQIQFHNQLYRTVSLTGLSQIKHIITAVQKENLISHLLSKKLYSKTRSRGLITNFNQLGLYQSMKKLNLILNSAQLEKVMSEKYVKNIFTIGRNDDEDHKIGHQQQPDTLFLNLP